MKGARGITLKSEREIALMRKAGGIVREALTAARDRIRAGATTAEVNEAVEVAILSRGGRLAFKGYVAKSGQPPFPAGCCVSVNDEVVHGIPGRRVLKEGDLVSVDVGAEEDGYFADAAITVPVGAISKPARVLLRVTEQALGEGIRAARPGARLSAVAGAIQDAVEDAGFSVVRQFVGHGIGTSLHEEPQVPNYVSAELLKNDVTLLPGLVIAIEPMVNVGGADVVERPDRWTVVTRDGTLSAHFEHTVAVTEAGAEVLTA